MSMMFFAADDEVPRPPREVRITAARAAARTRWAARRLEHDAYPLSLIP